MEENHTDNPVPADPTSQPSAAIPTDESTPANFNSAGEMAAPQERPKAAKDERRVTRFHVKWRADAVIATAVKQVTYPGWLKDISMSGTAIFSDKAIPLSKSFELYIDVPAVIGQKEHVLTLQARVVYCVYDASAGQFRTGIEFSKFASSNEQIFLATYLSKHCHPLSH